MSSHAVEEYLKGKGCEVFPAAGGRELTLQCLFCGENHRKGKLYVNAEHGAFDCFAGDTGVITWDGTFPIRDLAGTTQRVLTSAGWQDAPILAFGKRQLWKVVLTRNKVEKVIYATKGHRWLASRGRKGRPSLAEGAQAPARGRVSWREVTTDRLRPGHTLVTAQLPGSTGTLKPTPWGIAHGVVFGDGHRAAGGFTEVNLYGEKDAQLLRYFPLSPKWSMPDGSGVRVQRLPNHFKDLPSLDESPAYLYGWLAGYFAADGWVSTTGGTPALTSSRSETLEFVRMLCNRLGIRTNSVRRYERTSPGVIETDDPGHFYQLSFARSSLNEHFFLVDEHRKRWEVERAYERDRWVVRSVEPTDRVEEVYCAVVEGVENFAIEDHILTGNCKVCGHSGGWKTLLEHFGDEWDDEAPIARTSRRLQIHEEYLALAEQALWANERAVNFWRERGLSEQTIREFRLGYHPQGWSLVDSMPNAGKPGGYTRAEIRETGLLNERGDEFLEGRLIIPYLSSRSVMQLRGRQFDKKSEWGGKYVTPPGSEVMLFNSDALRGAEHVWLAEGEADAMIVHQHLKSAPDVKGRRFAVVAIPGVEALPGGRKGFPKYFESAKRVYVALDTDDTGRRAALEVRDVIGSHARILDYGKGFEDASDFLAPRTAENPDGGRDWQDLLRLVTETDMRNKRIFSVEEAAAQLYALEHGRPGIKLGWPTLDALISPGIYPGAVVVPLAKTGVGKTVLLTQIAWANRHRPTLFVSLELTAPEVWNRMRRTARFYEPAMTEEQHFGLLPQLRLMDENRMRSSDFEHLLDEFTEEVGQPPELVLIDYLGYYARGASGRDQYERMTNATMELKALAKEFGVAVITPGQVNRSAKSGEPIDLDSARDSGAVEETADFMFGVWRPWESEDIAAAGKPGAVQSELTVRILKSRRGNKGRQATLHMSHASLVVVDGSDRIATNRVQQENAWVNQGETYEQIYQRQRRRALAEAQGQLPPWER